MGQDINIGWGNLDPAPDVTNSFMTAFNAGHQMGIERQGDAARQNALANPTDQDALMHAAVFAPETAQAIYANQDRQRMMLARQAAGQVMGSYFPAQGQPNAFAPPVAQPQPSPAPQIAPQAAPQAPQRTIDLPGVGPAPLGQPQAPQPANPAQAPQQPGQPPQSPASSPITDPTHPVTQAIGQAAMRGQIDPGNAWQTLYTADSEMGDKMVAAVKGIDGIRLARLGEANGALGAEAQSLLQLPQAQRAAALQQIAPQLMAHGVTPQQIQGAMQEGLSDNLLHGVVGQAIGTQGLIDQSNKDREAGFKDRETTVQEANAAETARHNQADENQGVVVPNPYGGSSLVRRSDGSVIYNNDGSGGGGGGATLDPSIVSFFQNKGYSPAQARGIAAGIAAESANNPNGSNPTSGAMGLGQWLGARKAALIAQYGPNPTKQQQLEFLHSELQGGDPGGKAVLASTDANSTLNAYVNNFMRPGGGAAGDINRGSSALNGTSAPSMQQAMQTRAAQIANYESAVSAREKAGSRGNAVMAMVQQINPNYDETQYAVHLASAKDFAVKNGNVVRSLNVAVQHLDTLQATADALHNGNVPMFNRLSQSIAQATGGAAPTNMDAVKQLVMNEVIKATTGTAGGVDDRRTAGDFLSRASSPDQVAGAIYNIKRLMGGQLKGLARQYQGNTGRTDFGSRYLDPHTAAVLGFGSGQPAPPSDIAAIMQKYGATT